MLMNNGIMWFDPAPGSPNSLAPNKKCLMTQDFSFAVGASGGRKIMPAVMQLSSFLCDFDMDLETAFHQPRIDMSGSGEVVADHLLDDETHRLIAARAPELSLPFCLPQCGYAHSRRKFWHV